MRWGLVPQPAFCRPRRGRYIVAMNRPALLPGLAALVLSVAAGCDSTRTDRFDIDLRNDTSKPLTLSLAKDRGAPYEPAWATPEDVAVETPRLREDWAGGQTGMAQVVPPGKSASVRGLVGAFYPNTRGYVRAYAGELNISQMLARSAGSPDRVDVPLAPGANRVTIVEDGARVVAKRE